MVRRVDPLLAELRRRLAQPLLRVLQVLAQIPRQRRFGRRPAIVRFAFLDPLLAVIALVARHAVILRMLARARDTAAIVAEHAALFIG